MVGGVALAVRRWSRPTRLSNVHRLRVGHSHLTHSYLLKKEQPPSCESCHVPLTLEHVLIVCTKYAVQREKYLQNVDCLEDLFNCVSYYRIVEYIKEIGIYRKI